jgi:hypothetical protein
MIYSTMYRRSGYAPGFTNKQNEYKQKPKQQRKLKTSTTPLLNKGKLNNDHMQAGLDLGFYGLILWGWFSCSVESSEVLNADQALWVICFVGCATGGILERGVNTSTPSVAGRDRVEVVICGMLLGIYSTGWFVCFA